MVAGIILLCVVIFLALALLFMGKEADEIAADRETKSTQTPAASPPPESPEEVAHRLTKQNAVAAKEALRTGQIPLARELLDKVDPTTARLPVAWEATARLKLADSDITGAIDFLSKGISENPTAELFHVRGKAHSANGDKVSAMADAEKAAELSPSHALFTNERLLLLIENGRAAQVREEIDARVSTGNVQMNDLWILGLCALALAENDFDQAATLLAMAKRTMRKADFDELLENPAIARYQGNPKILPYYFTNAKE